MKRVAAFLEPHQRKRLAGLVEDMQRCQAGHRSPWERMLTFGAEHQHAGYLAWRSQRRTRPHPEFAAGGSGRRLLP